MQKLGGYEFWKSIGSPKFVCAPMVDQSELPFRLLIKEYGVTLAYTPMLHGRYFQNDKKYRQRYFQFEPELEVPVFAQFCTHDPNIFVNCGKLAWEMSGGKIAAIDLNLGCPQRIAKRGRYGSFLMEDFDLVYSIINKAHLELPIPVTAKIRIFEDLQLTLQYVDTVVSAGAQVLCVHGRTRAQKGPFQNYADWNVIKAIREHVPQIPVIANGNIRTYQDVLDCLQYTGVDAVMSAEALLENPSLFNKGEHVHPLQVCDRYVDICKHHFPPDHNNIKRHLFRILDRSLGGAENNDLRIMLGKAKLWEHYRGFVDHIKEHQERLDFSNYIVDYEPSIRVVEDPENHPIIKNPKKNRQEDDVASDNGDNSCCEEEEDVE